MSNSDLKNTVRLTDEEIDTYMKWAAQLQEEHGEITGGPTDSLTISFELSIFGTRVIAHTSSVPEDAPQIELRSDW